MVVATILSCAAPKEIARKDIESDYKIELETWLERHYENVSYETSKLNEYIHRVLQLEAVVTFFQCTCNETSKEVFFADSFY